MPNQIDSSGLQTATRDELTSAIVADLQAIYGPDINVDSDSPDGQLINIFVQAVLDNLDLLAQIYNSFDPDLAIGRSLDERCAINGIQRLGGTYTMQNIDVTVDRAVTLQGLDGDLDNPDGTGYTVSDNAGNQFILAATQSPAGAGTYTYAFRAKNNGAVQTVPNTITTPVTIVLGVTSVNNPTVLTTLGIDEETDAQLRIRRQKSVAISSQGYAASLLAALLNINGVTSAFVYENTTDATDGDGIPGHSIWVIMQGGDDNAIGAAIYAKRNAGCGMKGSEEVSITQADGTTFTIKFDRVVSEDLYIKFNAHSMDGIGAIDTTYIKNQLVLKLTPGVNEAVNVNELATLVQEIDPNCLVTITAGGTQGLGLSGGGTFYNQLSPSAKNKQFAVSAAHMTITVV